MRIIHTSDWHIGQTFFDYDRKEEHLLFFDWLIEQIEHYQAELLIIAGDVFDTPNPSAESQRLFYRFLHRISNRFPQLQSVIVAGNHDSAARLEAPNPLLETMNVTIRGVITKKDGVIDYDRMIIPIRTSKLEVLCLAVPYLRQGDYPSAMPGEENSHAAGVTRLYCSLLHEAHNRYGEQVPCIAIGHLQAIGSQLSDTDRAERTIIGGLEAVSPDFFGKCTTYTALGHLHKAQQVGGASHVRYSGTPLPMSFAEKGGRHGVTLVEVEAVDRVIVQHLDFTPPVALLSLPSKPETLEIVLKEIEKLPEGTSNSMSPFLEIKVLNDGPDPTRRFRIEEALRSKAVRLAAIHAVAVTTGISESESFTFEQLQSMTPFDLALKEYKKRYADSMPAELQQLLQKVISEVESQLL